MSGDTIPLRPHTAEEDAALRASVARHGLLSLPLVRTTDGRLVDGRHRAAIAEEMGATLPEIVVEADEDIDVLELALDLQVGRRNLTDADRVDLVEALHKRGLSNRQIAERLGVGRSTVDRVVQDLDLARGRAEREERERAERAAQAQALAADGKNEREIAKALGVSQKTANRAKKKAESSAPNGAGDSAPKKAKAEVDEAAKKWLARYRAAREALSFIVSDVRRLGPQRLVASWSKGDRKNALIEFRGLAKRVQEIITALEEMQG